MQNSINALLDSPLLLFLVLGAGALIGIAVERLFETQKRAQRRAFWKGRNGGNKRTSRDSAPVSPGSVRPPSDAADQLRAVMAAQYSARPLLNNPERRLLAIIDKALDECSPGWRAMGQVALGEVLWSDDKDAYWAINAKRVDLLIVDADCKPVLAVEFQGTGHHLSQETAARDAAKKEALRRAGIGYAEVVSGDTPADVRDMIKKWAARAATDLPANVIPFDRR